MALGLGGLPTTEGTPGIKPDRKVSFNNIIYNVAAKQTIGKIMYYRVRILPFPAAVREWYRVTLLI